METPKTMIYHRVQKNTRSKHHTDWKELPRTFQWQTVLDNAKWEDFSYVYKINGVVYKYISKSFKKAFEQHRIMEQLKQ